MINPFKRKIAMDKTQIQTQNLEAPKVGSLVEIRRGSAWYEGTIAQRQTKPHIYTVEYSSPNTKNSPFPLKEIVSSSMIRPLSPCKRSTFTDFEAFQEVEAFYKEGWWSGVVVEKNLVEKNLKKDELSYKVFVVELGVELLFTAFNLRNKMEWIKGNWISVEEIDKNEDKTHPLFGEGKQVEVSSERQNYGVSWYAATILKMIRKSHFLVKYTTSKRNNETSSLQEIVDVKHIRPCPPVSKFTSYKMKDTVEVLHEGSWILGVISVILSRKRYIVKIYKGQEMEAKVLNHTSLRPHYVWSKDHWDQISQDVDFQDVMSEGKKKTHSNEGQDQSSQSTKKLKIDMTPKKSCLQVDYHHPSKNSSCKSKLVSGNSAVSNINISSCDKIPTQRESSIARATVENFIPGSCTYKKNLYDHGESENKLHPTNLFKDVLEVESNNSRFPITDCNMNTDLPSNNIVTPTQSPVVCSIEDCLTVHVDNVCERKNITVSQVDADAILNRNISEKDKYNGCETSLSNNVPVVQSQKTESPFSMKKKDELNKLVESTNEVLRLFPQDPHFHPLQKYEKAMGEGLACGFMMAFAGLVTDVRSYTIDDVSEKEIEGKLKSLDIFEEYGFNVEPMQTRLNNLIVLRKRLDELEGKKKTAVAELEEAKHDKESDNDLLSEIEKNIMSLNEKRTSLIQKMKKHDSEIVNLESVARTVEDDVANVKRQFNATLTNAW